MRFSLSILIIFLFFSTLSAQKEDFSSRLIPDSLKQNANAIVRLDQLDILISSQRNMKINNRKVVTIFNENGEGVGRFYEFYSKGTSVKNIEAIILDATGNIVKKIKRKDFIDQCATDGGTVFSDNRVLYFNYTPVSYPFTIVYESEIETSTTAFIPNWQPMRANLVSLEKCILNVSFPDNLGFKKKECNFSKFKIEKTIDTSTQLSYQITNIPAQKYEEFSPAYSVFPKLMMGLELFHLEGVDGNAKTWKEFGLWYSDKILTGTADLTEETKLKIQSLVGNEKDNIKKARIIYDYLQEKSRYVSIQVGIGGWKPMLANDVDRLGYGDCKALSNYTKALLEAVEVPSYLTLLYGDGNKHDIESDFVSMQGNHMILAIPNKGEYVFLECTSQDNPFGYQANFTDDRDVLIIKPDGGEIVRTKKYENKDNTQISIGNYSINENGDFSGTIKTVSTGVQYRKKYHLETSSPKDQEKHYKEYWNNINNLKINKINFLNDREKISFTENLSINAVNYGAISNNKLIFVINAFNPTSNSFKRIRNRVNPFEIPRGYFDTDEIEVTLPNGFVIESLPTNFELNTKFGEYKTEIIKKSNNNLVYKRSIFIKKELYKNTEYDECRLFMEQISRNDNAKIVLTKTQ